MSDEATQIQRAAGEAVDALERSEALFGSKASAIAKIWRLARECAETGWDGYGAKPVLIESVRRAMSLIRALRIEDPMQEIGVEPDGSIALEWHRSRYAALSLSVGAENGLAYAWLDGSDRGHGVALFENERFPPRVLQQVRLIMGGADAPVRPS